MVRTVLGLLLALWVGAAHAQGPQGGQAIICNKIAIGQNLAAGTTQLVIGVAGQIVNWCGSKIDMNANGTYQIVFGTGATCTNPTNVTAVITTLTNDHLINHLATAFTSSAPGQSVCVIVTGTGSVINIEGYYQQSP